MNKVYTYSQFIAQYYVFNHKLRTQYMVYII